MMQEKNYDFLKRMRQIFKPDRRDPKAAAGKNEIVDPGRGARTDGLARARLRGGHLRFQERQNTGARHDRRVEKRGCELR